MDTAADRVTVKVASAPSVTSADGPLMLRYVASLSWMVMTAEAMTKSPELPPTIMVSSPSTSVSSIRVRVRAPSPLVRLAGMVTLAVAGAV